MYPYNDNNNHLSSIVERLFFVIMTTTIHLKLSPLTVLVLVLAIQLCAICEAQGDFKIAGPVSGDDFDISTTPEPAEMRGFSVSSSAHDRLLRSFGKITGISYTDSVSGVEVSFSGSMVGLSNGATGSTTSGGKHMGTAVAGTTGKGGFGLGLGIGIGTNIPGVGAGGGAVGSVGNAAFSSHAGKAGRAGRGGNEKGNVESQTTTVQGKTFSAAQGISTGKTGTTRSLHGRNAKSKNTENSSAAGGTGIGGAVVATGSGSGGVSMGTGTVTTGEDGRNVVSTTGNTAASGAISSGMGGTISLAQGIPGGSTGLVNNTAGNPGTTSGAVAVGESVAVGRGRKWNNNNNRKKDTVGRGRRRDNNKKTVTVRMAANRGKAVRGGRRRRRRLSRRRSGR